MARRIIIEGENLGTAPPSAPEKTGGVIRQMDLQDWLLIGGVVFLEGAAWIIWHPAALILAGCFCFGFAWLIEIANNGNRKS